MRHDTLQLFEAEMLELIGRTEQSLMALVVNQDSRNKVDLSWTLEGSMRF